MDDAPASSSDLINRFKEFHIIIIANCYVHVLSKKTDIGYYRN